MYTISVIIPCFNSETTIVRAVTSVIAQTITPKEVILVDDCSTDSTVATIEYLQLSSPMLPIRLVRTPINSGPGIARNIGISESTGDIIALLDADDWWHFRKLEVSLEVIVEQSDITFIGHKRRIAEYPGEGLYDYIPPVFKRNKVKVWQLLITNSLATSTVVIKRNVFDHLKFGSREYAEDYLLWLELLERNYKGLFLEYPGAFCEKGRSSHPSYSGNLMLHEMRELATLNRFCKLYKNRALEIIVLTWSVIKYFRRLFRGSIF